MYIFRRGVETSQQISLQGIYSIIKVSCIKPLEKKINPELISPSTKKTENDF